MSEITFLSCQTYEFMFLKCNFLFEIAHYLRLETNGAGILLIQKKTCLEISLTLSVIISACDNTTGSNYSSSFTSTH